MFIWVKGLFEFPSLVSCVCRFLFVDTHIYLGWGGTDLNLPRLCQLNFCKARLQVVPLCTKNWRASLGNLHLILQGCPRNLTWSFSYISSTHWELFICFAWCSDHSRFENNAELKHMKSRTLPTCVHVEHHHKSTWRTRIWRMHLPKEGCELSYMEMSCVEITSTGGSNGQDL